jgi:hypothetical protein
LSLLKKEPAPELALKVKHILPELSLEIFKQASIKEFNRGSREHYAQGASWAKEYKALENDTIFKAWLKDLLELNKRRPALLDEVKKAKLS